MNIKGAEELSIAQERLYVCNRYYLKLSDAVSESNYTPLSPKGRSLQTELIAEAIDMLHVAKADYDDVIQKYTGRVLKSKRVRNGKNNKKNG